MSVEQDPPRPVGLVTGRRHLRETRNPKHPDRGVLVHSLIQSLGVEGIDQVEVEPEDREEAKEAIELYHNEEYVRALMEAEEEGKAEMSDEDEKEGDEEEEEEGIGSLLDLPPPPLLEDQPQHGLAGDCPSYAGVWTGAVGTAAGTLAAARGLLEGRWTRTVHWEGGRHHARPGRAEGFCYAADVVFGVNALMGKFKKIAVLDLDAHHGDSTQEAFYRTPNVLTCSFHMHGPGVYPTSSGSLHERGLKPGEECNVNIPFLPGVGDQLFFHAFRRVAGGVRQFFSPDAVVLVLGADAVAGDPIGDMRLSIECLLRCLEVVDSWDVPMLVLGGGGYHEGITARYWACATALLAGGGGGGGDVGEPDPCDSTLPPLPPDALRRLPPSVSSLPPLLPSDTLPAAVYARLAASSPSLLPVPPPSDPVSQNTLEMVQYMVHLSLHSLLKLHNGLASLPGRKKKQGRRVMMSQTKRKARGSAAPARFMLPSIEAP